MGDVEELHFALGTPANGKVVVAFADKVVKVQVVAGKDRYQAAWTYTNPHELPLVVQDIESDCGCLVPKVDSSVQIAQGKSGTISAEFSPGARKGFLRRTLTVRFVGYDQPVKLTFEAKIPSPVEVSAMELSWTRKNITQAQTLEVTTSTDEDFTITDLTGVPERLFRIQQETVKAKRHYRLRITPTDQASKAQPSVQHLQIHTDAEHPNAQLIEVYLRVK